MSDKTTTGYRIDATPTGDVDLLPPTEGPGGSLFVEGIVARPGIYEYRRADGSVRRELVRRDDLWSMDSIETLGRAPLTVEHPPEMITPDNYRTYAHGDSSEEIIEAKKGFVKVRLALRSREALDAAKAGKTQLSPGYRVETLEEPGEDPEFGRYDAIQLRRTYNHIAMTDAARGGDAMAYRVDSTHGEVLVGGRVDDKDASSDAEEMYSVPEAASNNAKKALKWLEEKEGAQGMTPAGIQTARKLASGEEIPLSLVAKMAGFARHRKNSEVDPQYKDEPWRDAGYVAWLGWGGTTGVDWARGITGADEGDSMEEKEEKLDVVEEIEETDAEVVEEDAAEEEVVEEEPKAEADEEVVEEEPKAEADEEVVEEEAADEEVVEEEAADEEAVEEETDAEEVVEEEKADEDSPLTAEDLKAELAAFQESMQELLKPLLALIPQEEEMPGRSDNRVDSLLSDPKRYHMLRSRFDAVAQDLQVCYGDDVNLSDLARALVEKARPELKFDCDADYIAAAQMVTANTATVNRADADSIPPTISVRSPYGPQKN